MFALAIALGGCVSRPPEPIPPPAPVVETPPEIIFDDVTHKAGPNRTCDLNRAQVGVHICVVMEPGVEPEYHYILVR